MRSSATGNDLRTDRGVVYVEFLLAFMPVFLLMIALVQLALISAASILVKHAAYRAARAAIVVLPDDHESADYGGDPVNRIADGEGLAAYRNAHPRGRLAQIRTVARMLLSPLGPSPGALMGTTLSDALTTDIASILTGVSLWSERAVAVTFPGIDGEYRTHFGAADSIPVTVTCLFPCTVPIVSVLMCHSWSGIADGPRARLESNNAGGVELTALSGGRVVALEATATLPNQGE